MRRGRLPALFFGWLYGVAFLFVVAFVRRLWLRSAAPADPTHTAAVATDVIMGAALVLNAVLPVAGLLLARRARDAYWTRHFAGSLAGAVLYYVMVVLATGMAGVPLLGAPRTVPSARTGPAAPVHRCVALSGGRDDCPGG